MPIIKSAKKRVKLATKAGARNAKTKRAMREALKAFSGALADGKKEQIAKAQRAAQSAIDAAVKKNVIHKNRGARKKAQLTAQAKSQGVKLVKKAAVKAKTVKKPVVKKTPAKKTTTKKPSQ